MMTMRWHTDLDAARIDAARRGLPILSLRLLGRLDEELSCANSRFFKQTLYPDPAVARMLGGFVLHWRSVRPVPKVRIDFGDGRVLDRTLTGNSVHLILDAAGRPVDAVPGLYGARQFLRALAPARAAALAPRSALPQYHRERVLEIHRAIARDLGAIGASQLDDDAFSRLAGQAAADAPLWPDARRAGRVALTKRRVEEPILDLLGVGRTIAEDGLRNEYLLRPRIHRHLATGPDPDEATLTEWIYEELFLMPLGDPWLGLRQAFAALN
jgi:hypothetical protein